jgi:hypothetical protein
LFAAGDTVFIQNRGAGVCTITAGTATVNTHGSLALAQYEGGQLYFTATGAAIFFDVSQSTGMTNPMTTTGDTIYSSSGSTPARLGIGSTGQVLTVAGGIPSWATPAGGVTFSGCSLYKSANQSVANNTGTAITFDTEVFDTDGYHSTSSNTSRITIPTGKTGYYLISGTLSYAFNATGGRWCFVKKNGAAYIGSWSMQAATASGQWTAGAISNIAYLAAADYVEIFAEHTAGVSLNVNGGSTEGAVFQIQYLGA